MFLGAGGDDPTHSEDSGESAFLFVLGRCCREGVLTCVSRGPSSKTQVLPSSLEEASESLCHVEPFLMAFAGLSPPWNLSLMNPVHSKAPQALSRAFGWVDHCNLLWVTVGNQD